MALQVGELSVALELDAAAFRAQLTAVENALKGLPNQVQVQIRQASRNAGQQGGLIGGRLSEGISQGIVRNSPLIAAAIGGALAAGAPAILAGATLGFGGIGAVVAAQNEEVQSSWVGLWDLIKDESATAAAAMVPVFDDMADKIGTAFQRITPALEDAFDTAAPQIDGLVDSLLTAAQSALPGLVTAVEASGPAMEGLGHIAEQIGTGLTGMFEALADSGPAAGAAFREIGDTVGALLPTLGELLGTGVELASAVLPMVSGAFEMLGGAVSAVADFLPMALGGFLAFRAIGAITPMLAGFAQSLAFASYGSGRMAGAAGRASNAVSGMASGMSKAGAAIPALGAVLVGIGMDLSAAADEEDAWAQALLRGGQAAEQAREAYAAGNYFGSTVDEATGLASSMEDAQAKAAELLAQMTPLERATTLAEQAQNNYTAAVDKYGQNSPQAAAALAEFQRKTADAEREQGELEMALHGVTQAMVDQANQALAAIDSGFAYQHAVNGAEDAQKALNEAIAAYGPSSEEAQRASLDLAEANYQTALAFGQQQADMSGAAADSQEYARILQTSALQELHRLRQAAGPELAAALDQQIARLEASGVSLEETGVHARAARDKMRELGFAVTNEVPGYKGVRIDAPTDAQRQQIEALGYKIVTLPDGSVYVTADTSEAERLLANATRTRYVQIIATTDPGSVARTASVGSLARQAGGRAAGGPIFGPGTGTSDTAGLYALSNGEHVLTAAEVRAAGGHGAIYDLRAELLAAGRGRAAGGPVGVTADAGRRVEPVFRADTVNIIEGSPHEVARILSLEARTR